jgi:hypothetical protein
VPRAGVDVDMRINASLADQPQLRKPLQQASLNLGPLANEDQHLGLLQAVRQNGVILDVIVEDRDVVRSVSK